MLRLKERRESRKLAAELWVESGYDVEKCKALWEERKHGFDIATALLIFQVMLQLWEWWSKRNKTEISEVPDADEPISWEED
jgi:hypothetical protein